MELIVRALREDDLPAADRVFRLAFCTLLGLPDPTAFAAGADYVRSRWLADPAAAFGAECDGELVASNFATSWGSVGLFGPLTVHPDMWDQSIGKQLLEPVIDLFATWGTVHAGLFTSPQSAKHVGLYQRFGFWPRFLTAITSKPVGGGTAGAQGFSLYSELPASERESCLDACRDVAGAVYEGLDLQREIRAAHDQGIGETVLLGDGDLSAFAVCHLGAGSEAGPDACYVKFAAVRPGRGAPEAFERLLDACEALAAGRGLARVSAGMSLEREDAYRRLVARGYRAAVQGVTMHRPNDPGYNRPDVYLIDDWR